MIDSHCHILPNLDDGPATWEEALEMAKIASEDGIKTIIATPHYKRGVYENTSQTIFPAVSELNQKLEEQGILLKILPGMEISFYPELLEDLLNGKILTLNQTSYLLIEFPNEIHLSSQIEQSLFQIQLKGYIPILAHIERCVPFFQNFTLLEEWHARGIECQLTSSSLNGLFGREVQRFARQAIQKGLIDYLVTDSHSVSKFGRKPVLSEGVDKVSRLVGRPKAIQLVIENPERILDKNGV